MCLCKILLLDILTRKGEVLKKSFGRQFFKSKFPPSKKNTFFPLIEGFFISISHLVCCIMLICNVFHKKKHYIYFNLKNISLSKNPIYNTIICLPNLHRGGKSCKSCLLYTSPSPRDA